jgi:CheY-like chemotaxis protein
MHEHTLVCGTNQSRIEFGDLAAESRPRAEQDLLAVCAHELRNPLASLQCNLELLRGRIASPALTPHLELMEWQTRKLARIVEDLLDMTRASQGKLAVHRECVDIAVIVKRAIESVRYLLQERRHQLAVALPERAVYVSGDPVRLEQVLVNLIVNACKYTDDGGSIAVTVDAGAGSVALRVRDSGVGMSPEALARAFDLFAQVGGGGRGEGGLGVGLAVVKQLVELHGGTVQAASEGAGLGCEFTVTLPVVASEPELGSGPPAPAPGLSGAARKRVLVVDDSKDVADALGALIVHLGHTVRIAGDGPSALRVAQEWLPDIVFLDIALPCMDGYAVATELRSARPNPPLLIALTGYADGTVGVRARQAGMAKHLVKPPRLSAIQALLAGGEAEVAPPPARVI